MGGDAVFFFVVDKHGIRVSSFSSSLECLCKRVYLSMLAIL